MKFDVVVGNPPYQESDGGAQSSSVPIYHKFYELSKKISLEYVDLIFPARWYVGGKGLDSFRKDMLNDKNIKKILDYQTPEDIFPGTNIRGGLSVVIADNNFDNSIEGVEVINILKGEIINHQKRPMKVDGFNIFIRNNDVVSILGKMTYPKGNISDIASPRKPYGISGDFINDDNFRLSKSGMIKPIKIYGKRKVGFIENNLIKVHKEWVKGFKVFTARSNNIGTELHDDNLNTKIGYPNEIVTETYLVIGGDIDLNLNSARNLSNYLKTKFSRFLISIAKSTQDAPRATYKFVPMQDFTLYSDIDWSKSITEIDQQLYKKYKLTKDEIYVINTTIVEMD